MYWFFFTYMYSETCLNQTCLNQTDFTVPSTKCLCNLSLCNPNTCLNWTDSSVPKGFGLDRFYCTFIMKRMFKQWWSTIPPISNCMFYCLANLVRHNVNTCNPFTYLGSKFNYYLFQRSPTCLDIDKCIMNNLLCYFLYLRIDLNFFSVLEEINSKMWYTHETQGCVPNFLVYFEWTNKKLWSFFRFMKK